MDCQGTCEIPFTSTREVRRNRSHRLTMAPGLMSVLHALQERLGEHEHRGCVWCLRPKP
jgi:hypothetical protein